jgi:vacuolar-type H+-ATPase subunit H
MENIDPESHKRINTAIGGLVKALQRIRDEVAKATIALNKLAFELDNKTRASAEEEVSRIIERAKN